LTETSSTPVTSLVSATVHCVRAGSPATGAFATLRSEGEVTSTSAAQRVGSVKRTSSIGVPSIVYRRR